VGDTVKIFKDNNVKFYNEIIFKRPFGTLPMRAGKYMKASRKVGKTHENILVFYKGNIDKIKENFGKIEVKDVE